jgi:uncharacterized membrane protein YdbT with pleckstrin-like domain
LVLALGVNVLFISQGINAGPIVTLLWLAVLFMIIRMLWKSADWQFIQIIITNRRLLRISGVFFRKVQTIPLTKITDMTYNRDLLGRILGYGEFVVETEGDDPSSLSKLPYLPRPDRLYLTFVDMTFGGAPTPAGED